MALAELAFEPTRPNVEKCAQALYRHALPVVLDLALQEIASVDDNISDFLGNVVDAVKADPLLQIIVADKVQDIVQAAYQRDSEKIHALISNNVGLLIDSVVGEERIENSIVTQKVHAQIEKAVKKDSSGALQKLYVSALSEVSAGDDVIAESEKPILAFDPEAAMDTSNFVEIAKSPELRNEVVSAVTEQIRMDIVNKVVSQKLHIPVKKLEAAQGLIMIVLPPLMHGATGKQRGCWKSVVNTSAFDFDFFLRERACFLTAQSHHRYSQVVRRTLKLVTHLEPQMESLSLKTTCTL